MNIYTYIDSTHRGKLFNFADQHPLFQLGDFPRTQNSRQAKLRRRGRGSVKLNKLGKPLTRKVSGTRN